MNQLINSSSDKTSKGLNRAIRRAKIERSKHQGDPIRTAKHNELVDGLQEKLNIIQQTDRNI